MEQQDSASYLFKQAAGYISSRMSAVDVDVLDKPDQRAVKELKRLVVDTRLDIRDYEYADTRYELEQHRLETTERLSQLRAAVLATSEAGIFGAADVAQLSAQLDAVAERL